MKRLLVALAALLCLSGCKLTGPTTFHEADDLAQARAKWQQLDTSRYNMQLNRSCFCIGTGSMTVMVQSDSVAAIREPEYQVPSNSDWWQYIPTVNGLFDLIEEAERDAFRVDAEYHPQQGYPVSVSIDWLEDAVDDEISYAVESLDFTPDDEVHRVTLEHPATLSNGDTLSLVRIEQESRCPQGVQCIQAGELQVLLLLNRNDVPIDARLIIPGDPVQADNVRLQLIAASPYPNINVDDGQIAAEDYELYLSAEIN